MTPFDYVVLTAANAAQARGYRAQLQWRRETGLFSPKTRLLVVPDPGGRRVGSLGATLNVLRLLAADFVGSAAAGARLTDLFAGKRILICHSGGDSRRLPAYAAQGKVFTPMPTAARHGPPAALFDLLLANLEQLPAPAAGHVLVASGDVLLTFDAAAVNLAAPGVVGAAYPSTLERGAKHGVYITASHAAESGCLPVAGFLQKPDEATAREHGAVDSVGRVLVDTGLLSMDPATVATLLNAAGVTLRQGQLAVQSGLLGEVNSGRCPGLDIYVELTLALPPQTGLPQYLCALGPRTKARAYAAHAKALYRALHGIPFSVNVVPDCDFFHIGASRELLANMSMISRTARQYGFTNFHSSAVEGGASLEGAFVFNSILPSRRVRAPRALIEAVHADVPLELQGGNILVGVPAGAGQPIRLKENVGLVCLPLAGRDWVAVLFGLEDDFKTVSGPAGGTFQNQPIEQWLAQHGISAATLWKRGESQDLWMARLWRRGPLEACLRDVAWMQGAAAPALTAAWLRRPRLNLARVLKQVDHQRLLAHRQELQRVAELHGLAARLVADDRYPAARLVAQTRDAADTSLVFDQLATVLQQAPPALLRARAWQMAEAMAQRHRVPRPFTRAFGPAAGFKPAALSCVAEAVSMAHDLPAAPRPAAILPDQVVWVTTPARLDFAGGWSDTPPISTEQGGSVLNAAVTLNGQYPIQVMAKLDEHKVIRLSSIDLGERVEIHSTEELLDHRDPRSWAALPKAALVLAGIGPSRPGVSLQAWLGELGGGLNLTIFSALPKGSGLGTSSILGAAVLACLGKVVGKALTQEELIGLTSILEQRMTTGGGWQDQVGGIVPGVKLIQTQPGAQQAASLRWTVFDMAPGSELRARLLLYFTGQKRMARDILHNVVARYLERDPATLATIAELKQAAQQMKADLDARDVAAFARGITRYWTLKKRIDPGATNAHIETLLRRVAPWTDGCVLPGAGGGGFVFFVAKDAGAARRIRHTLEQRPPNPLARFFDFDVDGQGLKVTVL